MMAKAKCGRPSNYERCIKIIVEANEHIVNDREDLSDASMEKLGELRSKLDEFEGEVVGRLIHSLFVTNHGKIVEVDEASDVGYDQ
jgi:hypothetical protein